MVSITGVYLYTPAWAIMSAIFFTKAESSLFIIVDCVSLCLVPWLTGIPLGDRPMNQLFFFHGLLHTLMLLSSATHDRDKKQTTELYKGTEHVHRVSRLDLIRKIFIEPHDGVSDRVWRRRSRVLSGCLLGAIPVCLLWAMSSFKSSISLVKLSMVALLPA